jgi:hypothetical protein
MIDRLINGVLAVVLIGAGVFLTLAIWVLEIPRCAIAHLRSAPSGASRNDDRCYCPGVQAW